MGIETLGISRYFRLSSTATLLFLKPLDLVSQRGVSTGGTAIFRTPVSFLFLFFCLRISSFCIPYALDFLWSLFSNWDTSTSLFPHIPLSCCEAIAGKNLMPHILTHSPQHISPKESWLFDRFWFSLITSVSFVSIRFGLRNGDQLLTLFSSFFHPFFFIFFFILLYFVQRKKNSHHRSRIWRVAIHTSGAQFMDFNFSSILLHIRLVW